MKGGLMNKGIIEGSRLAYIYWNGGHTHNGMNEALKRMNEAKKLKKTQTFRNHCNKQP